jgi:hypothetical protein
LDHNSAGFSGLTAYLITFAEYLPSMASLWVWHAGDATKKTGQHNKKQVLKLSS